MKVLKAMSLAVLGLAFSLTFPGAGCGNKEKEASCTYDSDCAGNLICIGGFSDSDIFPGLKFQLGGDGPYCGCDSDLVLDGTAGAEEVCNDDSDCSSGDCNEDLCECRGNGSSGGTTGGGTDGGTGGDCPDVNAEPGSQGFGDSCDEDADCSEGMPCVDCHCV